LFATWLATHPMASTVSANGGDNLLRFRPNATGNTNTSKIVISEKGKEMDKRLDKHETFVAKICFFNIFLNHDASFSIAMSLVDRGVSWLL